MRRVDKNKQKVNLEYKYKEELKLLFAISILLTASIVYAALTNPNMDTRVKETVTSNIEEKVVEVNRENRSDVNIAGIKESIKTLNGISKILTKENLDIKVFINEEDNNVELIKSLIDKKYDMVITSRKLNEEEKKITKERNMNIEELIFGYLTKVNGKKIYCYVNLDAYYKNISIRDFIKTYYKKNEAVIEKSEVSKLSQNIYDETLEYLNLLEIYKKE